MESGSQKKLAGKMPEWANVEGIKVPTSLAFEQCSSTASARFKAGLLVAHLSEGAARIADLTGGLGVDSWAFSEVSSRVWYNEMNRSLRECVEGNYRLLGIENVDFNSFEISAESIVTGNGEPSWLDSIKAFEPDAIYLDPARRDSVGRKVFLPEDCSPDFLTLMPSLLGVAKVVMVKLSPMADITMLKERISISLTAQDGVPIGHLDEIHTVGYQGECKELLCIIKRGSGNAGPETGSDESGITVNIIDRGFSFKAGSQNGTPSIADEPKPGEFVFEPHAAVIKAGLHDAVAAEYGCKKLDRFTNVYISDTDATIPQGICKSTPRRIIEVLPLSKAGMTEVASRYPGAEFSARNIPMTSDELAKRCRAKSSKKNRPASQIHIYGVSTPSGNFLIAAE